MSERENISTAQGRESEELCIQVSINGNDNYIEIPVDGEWHLVGYCDEDVVFDSIEVHSRVLSEDEISDVFQVFGNYADRVLSKEEIETIHKLLTSHSEIRSWQIRNNILYLEVGGNI